MSSSTRIWTGIASSENALGRLLIYDVAFLILFGLCYGFLATVADGVIGTFFKSALSSPLKFVSLGAIMIGSITALLLCLSVVVAITEISRRVTP